MRRELVLVALAACGNDIGVTPDEGPIDRYTEEARKQYPTIHALYTGEQGIYRGCGPNGGVCHNGNEYPILDSMGSILDTIDARCNVKRAPSAMDDLCEGKGDLVTIAGADRELGWLGPDTSDPSGRRWKLAFRGALPPLDAFESLPIRRDGVVVWQLGYLGALARDLTDDRAIYLDAYDDFLASVLTQIFKDAGRPGDAFQLGDPNGNGVFGADLGGRLVKPGDPANSYLMRRIVDPFSGPLMPRANCCAWSKPAVRAMWCWIDRLEPGGANATAPIDYDRCRPSPRMELVYPELGPACEGAGLCPPTAIFDGGEGFASIYRTILVPKCSGSGCHDRDSAGNVDFASESRAYETLQPKVEPGVPAGSRLWQRLDPATCRAPCKTMPLDRAPLGKDELDAIRTWIEAGAER